MNEAQILGGLLLAFIVMLGIAWMGRRQGWMEAVADMLIAIAVTAALFLGMGLLTGRIA